MSGDDLSFEAAQPSGGDEDRHRLERDLRALFTPVPAPPAFRSRLKAELLHGNERVVFLNAAPSPAPRHPWTSLGSLVARHRALALVCGALAVAAAVLLAAILSDLNAVGSVARTPPHPPYVTATPRATPTAARATPTAARATPTAARAGLLPSSVVATRTAPLPIPTGSSSVHNDFRPTSTPTPAQLPRPSRTAHAAPSAGSATTPTTMAGATSGHPTMAPMPATPTATFHTPAPTRLPATSSAAPTLPPPTTTVVAATTVTALPAPTATPVVTPPPSRVAPRTHTEITPVPATMPTRMPARPTRSPITLRATARAMAPPPPTTARPTPTRSGHTGPRHKVHPNNNKRGDTGPRQAPTVTPLPLHRQAPTVTPLPLHRQAPTVTPLPLHVQIPTLPISPSPTREAALPHGTPNAGTTGVPAVSVTPRPSVTRGTAAIATLRPTSPAATDTARPAPPTATYTARPAPPTATYTARPAPPTLTATPRPAPPTASLTPPDTAVPSPTPTAGAPHVIVPAARAEPAAPGTGNAIPDLDSPLGALNAAPPISYSVQQSINADIPASLTLMLGGPSPRLPVYPLVRPTVTVIDALTIAARLGAQTLLPGPAGDAGGSGSMTATVRLDGLLYTLVVRPGYGTAPWFTLHALQPPAGVLPSSRVAYVASLWLRAHHSEAQGLRLFAVQDGGIDYGQNVAGVALASPVVLHARFDGTGALIDLTDRYVALPPAQSAPALSPNIAASSAVLQSAESFYQGPDRAVVTGPAAITGLTLAYVGVHGVTDYLEPVYVLSGSAPTTAGMQPFNLYVSALQYAPASDATATP